MRNEIKAHLDSRPDLLRMVREEPYWYRMLSRDPENIYKLEEQAKQYYGKTIPQKLGRFNQQLQMIQMLLMMTQGMGSE